MHNMNNPAATATTADALHGLPPNANQETSAALKIWWAHLLTKRTQYVLDLMVLVSALALAYLMRFDFNIPAPYAERLLTELIFIVPLEFTALILAGVYTFIWRYIGISEIKAFLKAALWSSLLILALRIGMQNTSAMFRLPFSVIAMNAMFAFGGVLGVRLVRRALYERYEKHHRAVCGDTQRRVLLVGAGRAGVMTAKEITGRGNLGLEIKGFVDDDPQKRRGMIHGIKVLGTTADLPRLVNQHAIDLVVISIAQASRKEFRRILNICEEAKVKVQTIPGLYEILQGRVKVSRIRDVQIEDLLGREPVQLEDDLMKRLLSERTVMVTGAGGSIGSELTRQVARFQPSRLLLVERAEFALFNIDRELRQLWPELEIVPLMADVGDEPRMRSIFESQRPHVVFHAAAHKHVPMMESNATEAVKNNVLGTHLLGTIAGEYNVEAFVLISTDKAVCPTSVMGASKRVAELVAQNLNQQFEHTRYSAVRFGNVIGSAGSVIPIFREQIGKGGPVTVTHPDMVRFFMTIPEAAQLVLQSGAMGNGGEIFILDMGEPVRILDLAKETITLSGLKPYEDIDIVFTGMRPGEKLFEELQTISEQISKTRHPKIFIGNIAAYPKAEIRRALAQLALHVTCNDERELRLFLSALLPEAHLNCFPSQNNTIVSITNSHAMLDPAQTEAYSSARAS